MPQHRRASVHPYAFAIVAVVGTMGVWLLLRPLTGRAPGPILIASVALSAFHGGLGPGLLSALLASFARQIVIFRANVSFFDFENLLHIGVFFLVGLLAGARLARPEEKRTSARPYRHKRARATHHTRRRYLSIPNQRSMLVLKKAQKERSKLLHQAQEARRQAEAASRAKDEFLAILSHEMRTPLTSILGWVQMMRRGRVDAARLQRGLEVIERNSLAQARLIEDLLDVSRIISGKMAVEKKPIDLCPIVDTTIEALRPTAEAKGIKLDYEKLDHEESVLGDRERLGQVITNLLSNALKFTPRGGGVGLRMRRVDDEVEIQVRDTGIGIDPSFLPHLFNRFQQADTSVTRQYQGLGLGLAIVRYLVELHGGRVWAESAGKGEGALFTVRLPVLARASDAQESTAAHGVASKVEGLQVLLVEDDPDSRDFLVTYLEQQGLSVRAASSAREALEELEHFTPELLLSDIGLPGEDGYSLIRKVRAREKGNMPAIALTAYAKKDDQERALSAGFQRHVAKPVEGDRLMSTIAEVIRR